MLHFDPSLNYVNTLEDLEASGFPIPFIPAHPCLCSVGVVWVGKTNCRHPVILPHPASVEFPNGSSSAGGAQFLRSRVARISSPRDFTRSVLRTGPPGTSGNIPDQHHFSFSGQMGGSDRASGRQTPTTLWAGRTSREPSCTSDSWKAARDSSKHEWRWNHPPGLAEEVPTGEETTKICKWLYHFVFVHQHLSCEAHMSSWSRCIPASSGLFL